MSVNTPTVFAQQYATNIELLLQTKGSRLRQYATFGTYKGKAASPVDQLGAVEMQEVITRFGPMGRVDAPFDRRWIYPKDWDLPQLIDTFDKLRMLTDINGIYTQNAVNAAGRKMDLLLLSALHGDAKTGTDGSTTIALPTTQKVAINFGAAANTGLTVAKLREARRILMAADIDLDMDPMFAAVTAADHDNLLGEAQVISMDYNNYQDRPVLKEGKIERILGINLIHTEQVISAGGVGYVPVWVKSGLHLGIWNDVTTDISQRKDLQGIPWQIYVYMTMGATRLEEKRTVEIAVTR